VLFNGGISANFRVQAKNFLISFQYPCVHLPSFINGTTLPEFRAAEINALPINQSRVGKLSRWDFYA
jgi:hypothetical protein